MGGTLQITESDNNEDFEFLHLLKGPKINSVNGFNPLEKEDWSKVVNKHKKHSVSSFFQKGTMQDTKYLWTMKEWQTH